MPERAAQAAPPPDRTRAVDSIPSVMNSVSVISVTAARPSTTYSRLVARMIAPPNAARRLRTCARPRTKTAMTPPTAASADPMRAPASDTPRRR